MHQPFTLSSVTIFSKGASLYSLLLDYLLEGGNYLLSPPWLSSQRWQPSALSSLAIFSNAATLCLQPFALSSLSIVLNKGSNTYSLLLDYLLEGGNHSLYPPWLSSRKRQSFALSFLHSSQMKIIFFSLGFTLYIPSPHRENPWAKAIKFFVALSIYKTLFLFPLRLRIYYIFNKE